MRWPRLPAQNLSEVARFDDVKRGDCAVLCCQVNLTRSKILPDASISSIHIVGSINRLNIDDYAWMIKAGIASSISAPSLNVHQVLEASSPRPHTHSLARANFFILQVLEILQALHIYPSAILISEAQQGCLPRAMCSCTVVLLSSLLYKSPFSAGNEAAETALAKAAQDYLDFLVQAMEVSSACLRARAILDAFKLGCDKFELR